jgi:O-succinylbenzoate synthase
MYIDSIDVYYIVLPLISPWRTACGDDKEIHTVLVRMTSGKLEGWGETSPLSAPTYSPEFAMSAFTLIRDWLAPTLVGREIQTPEHLLGYLDQFKGNPFAKAGVESAWWMIKAASEEQPLHKLFGGETHPIEAGADFGVQDSYEILLEKIQNAVNRGYKRVKLKVRPGWDLEMLKIVRSTFQNLTMHIDCNSGYSLDDLPLFKKIDRMGLAMIEQPLFHTDLIDHAALQRQIETPICLDESVKSIRDFELALKLGSCRVLNIKYARVGGLSVALKLHNIAQENGILCWVGGMLESAIGTGINIELATLPNFKYPSDICQSRNFYQVDLTDPEVWMNSDCTFTPSMVPGTPYKPNLDRINKTTFKKTSITARVK